MLQQFREYHPWANPEADGESFICYLCWPHREGLLVLPIQEYDHVLLTDFTIEALLLDKEGHYEVRGRSNGLHEILGQRELDQLPLTDSEKLEMLVTALESMSSELIQYRLFRNGVTGRVTIVREGLVIEKPPVPAMEEPSSKLTNTGIAAWSISQLKACLDRGHHRLEGQIIINNSGSQPYVLRVCTDCRHVIAKVQTPIMG